MELGGRRNDYVSQECPTCLCKLHRAVTITCGHSYCGGCLNLMLENPSSFPITCMVDSCACPVALSILRVRLAPQTLDRILEMAGQAYLRQRPDEFKCCPTPGCSHYYRPGPEGSTLRCKSCLTDICAACHVDAHEGLTCAERREVSDRVGRLFRNWRTV